MQQLIAPGTEVVLNSIPSGLLDGLPVEDQHAIQAIIGKPVTLVGYSFGRAELAFTDAAGDSHSIWVDPAQLQV